MHRIESVSHHPTSSESGIARRLAPSGWATKYLLCSLLESPYLQPQTPNPIHIAK